MPGYLGFEVEDSSSPLPSILPIPPRLGRSEHVRAGDQEHSKGEGSSPTSLPSMSSWSSAACPHRAGSFLGEGPGHQTYPTMERVKMTGQWWVGGEAGLHQSPGSSTQVGKLLVPRSAGAGRGGKAPLSGWKGRVSGALLLSVVANASLLLAKTRTLPARVGTAGTATVWQHNITQRAGDERY